MNITEKILARAAGRDAVSPGEIVEVKVDVALTHEKLGPLFFPSFRELGLKVWDPEKVVIFADHGIPPSKILDANLIRETIKFARDYNLPHLIVGEGICHQVMVERGFVRPGEVVVGTDSHTVTYGALGAFATGIGSTEMAWVFSKGSIWMKVPETLRFNFEGVPQAGVMGKDLILFVMGMIGIDGGNYRAMEFGGEAIRALPIDDRLCLCNMVVEAGAKNGVIEPDEQTLAYVRARTAAPFQPVTCDDNARYLEVFHIDVRGVQPMVACPHSPANVKPVSEVEGVPINRAFIGSCTGGRLRDLEMAARILAGKRVHRDVMLQVIPASQAVYKQALNAGYIEVLLDAGAIICNPTCGPCAGSHMGVLGAGEVCISSTNRNLQGRMGDVTSEVYLASPATVAASAVHGKITNPQRIIGG